MPTPYSEPSGGAPDPISSAVSELAFARASGAAKAATLPTGTATNSGDTTVVGTTMIAQVAGINVQAGQKAIIHVSVELDVNPPEALGAAGTATLYARYQAGAGPEVVVDQKDEDLILGSSGVTLHNILSFTAMTAPLGAGLFAFDVSVSYTTDSATFVPNGRGRVVVQIVG